jgi:hypothetical protein
MYLVVALFTRQSIERAIRCAVSLGFYGGVMILLISDCGEASMRQVLFFAGAFLSHSQDSRLMITGKAIWN